jgi:hypothetical protein
MNPSTPEKASRNKPVFQYLPHSCWPRRISAYPHLRKLEPLNSVCRKAGMGHRKRGHLSAYSFRVSYLPSSSVAFLYSVILPMNEATKSLKRRSDAHPYPSSEWRKPGTVKVAQLV